MSVFLNDYTEIATILTENHVKKPFLCCGKSFQKTPHFQFLLQFHPVIFDTIRPNPRFDDMITAAELFRREGCDFMIAAGGGSPMDSAKMIRLMATNDIDKALTEPMQNNNVKAMFIPTTSGTGSEATKTAVFYLNETEKFSVHNYDFIPDYILLDEALLLTVPDYQRKATCLDALCHSIESYWCTKATEESREYAAKSIRLFFEHKDAYMKNEPSGNKGMLLSSYYGGKAINITGTTVPHALCYSITMQCGTAHGHSVALLLSRLWEYMLERAYPKDILCSLSRLMGGKTAQDGAEIFTALLNEFALSFPKIEESELGTFVSSVNPAKLTTNPVPFAESDVTALYKRVLL